MAIYRSVLPEFVRDIEVTGNALRPPVYISNLVDNLWEWRRPPKFPSRRLSAFASPSPELARQVGPPGGRVFQITLSNNLRACQVQGYLDSRDHPETSSLPILLYERLGSDWVASGLEDKTTAGRLWMPCVSPSEVTHLFADIPELRILREEIIAAVRYWNDVQLLDNANSQLNPEGEVFFEAPHGYRLTPVE
jgi:hypothetical protein